MRKDVLKEILLDLKGSGTIADLAALLGKSYTSTRNWVNGITLPDLKSLEAIAKAKGVPIEELMKQLEIDTPVGVSRFAWNAAGKNQFPAAEEKVLLNVRLPKSLVEKIESAGKSRSEVIREALELLFRQ